MGRTLITNKQGGETWVDIVASVQVTEEGEVVPTSGTSKFEDEVARGNVSGVSTVFKFGGYGALPTTETLVSNAGTATYPFTKLGETFRIAFKSSSADDSIAGTGAREIIIFYLDVDGLEQFAIFETNGATEVDTGIDANFVYRVAVTLCGADGFANSCIGNISIYDIATPANEHAQIDAGIGQTEMAAYRVPSNKKFLITAASFQVRAGKDCTFFLKQRRNEVLADATAFNAFTLMFRAELTVGSSNILPILTTPALVPENTDLIITGKMASQTGAVSASFGGRLYEITT